MNHASPSKIKLVCTDIDGTFNKHSLFSHDLVSDNNFRAVELLATKKIPLIIATGRDLTRALDMVSLIKSQATEINIPYVIALNGSIIFDTQKQEVISENDTTTNLTEKIITSLKKRKLHYFALDAASNLHIENRFFSLLVAYLWFHNYQKHIITPEASITDIKKIMVVSLFSNSFKLKGEIEAELSNVYVACSGKSFFEVVDKEVNKAIALKQILPSVRVTIDEVCCLGNEGNDIQMIEESGFGVTVDFEQHPHLYIDKSKVQYKTINSKGTAFDDAIKHLQSIDLI